MASIWNHIKQNFLWTTKKDAFIYLSISLLVFLASTIINDLVHLTLTEKTEKTTQEFTMALLFVHTLGFYFGLLGFVYITQTAAHSRRKLLLAVAAIVGNFVAFVSRITVEVVCKRYRHEFYRLATESGK